MPFFVRRRNGKNDVYHSQPPGELLLELNGSRQFTYRRRSYKIGFRVDIDGGSRPLAVSAYYYAHAFVASAPRYLFTPAICRSDLLLIAHFSHIFLPLRDRDACR